jgi:hypothetical protein
MMMLRKNGWIGVELTDAITKQAKAIRAERDAHYGNIYTEEDTDERWLGDAGEILFSLWLKHHNVSPVEWIRDKAAGKPDFVVVSSTADVKTVKRSVEMKPHYTAQITARHTKEKVDYYFFCVYEIPTGIFWLLGGIAKTDFLQKARYYSEGEYVHANYQIRREHEIYNIEVAHLTRPEEWLASLSAS